MRLRQRLTTCVLASLATLPCAFAASGQSALQPPPTAQDPAAEQRLEGERRKLEGEQRRLEQQRQRLETELRRAKEAAGRMKEQAEQAGRRAKAQAEQAARRASEQVQRKYQRALQLGQAPADPYGLPPGTAGQPPSDFERELFKAQGLDAGNEPGGTTAAFLGVSTAPAPASLRKRIDLPDGIGLVVSSVEPASPAEQAGVKQYDILHKLNEQLLVNTEQLAVLVRTFKPGEEVRLTLVRGGKPQELSVKLGERLQPPQPTQPHHPFGYGGGGFTPGIPPGYHPQPPQPGQPPRNNALPMPNPLRRNPPGRLAVPLPPLSPRAPRVLPIPPRTDPYAPAPAPAPAPGPVLDPAASPAPQLHVVPVPRPPAAPVVVAPVAPAPAPAPVAAPVPAEPVQR